jgi:hypothetical protein
MVPFYITDSGRTDLMVLFEGSQVIFLLKSRRFIINFDMSFCIFFVPFIGSIEESL